MGEANDSKSLTVVAVPFAGGDRYSYRALQSASPDSWIWTVLDLPGRGPRRREPRLREIGAMVDSLYSDFIAAAPQVPYLLMGHSMGAVLAYELLQKICDADHTLPEAVYFSGIAAPGVPRTRYISHLPKPEFWEVMRSYKGVPEGIIGNADLRDYFEPVLRDDFAAVERYAPLSGNVVARDVKICVRCGEDDAISDEDLAAWADVSSRPKDIERRPGGHFFLLGSPAETVAELKALWSADNRQS